MATDSEMAKTIGLSPESFSKRRSGIIEWKLEECIALTEIYGKEGLRAADLDKKVYVPDITIESLKGRLHQAGETIAAQNSEIAQHDRGTRIAWAGPLVLIFVCLVLITWGFWRPSLLLLANKGSGYIFGQMWELQQKNAELQIENHDLKVKVDQIEDKLTEIEKKLGVDY